MESAKSHIPGEWHQSNQCAKLKVIGSILCCEVLDAAVLEESNMQFDQPANRWLLEQLAKTKRS